MMIIIILKVDRLVRKQTNYKGNIEMIYKQMLFRFDSI